MPKYIALRDTWLSHDNRLVKEGEQFETTFPKVKLPDGKEVDMRLGDNLQPVEEEDKPTRKKKAAEATDSDTDAGLV